MSNFLFFNSDSPIDLEAANPFINQLSGLAFFLLLFFGFGTWGFLTAICWGIYEFSRG